MTVTAPLYARMMGSSWNQLAEPLRCLHGGASTAGAAGHLRIEHGLHPLARLLARICRLPPPSDAAHVRLLITAHDGREHWVRTFDGHRLETRQYEWHAGLAERFGAVEIRYRLQPSRGALSYVQRDAFLCWPVRVRIPKWWAPRVQAREDPVGSNGIRVDVRVMLPRIGLLIAYAGIVEVAETPP